MQNENLDQSFPEGYEPQGDYLEVPSDQDPPEGYEPQPDLGPDQAPELEVRPTDLIVDAEAEEPEADEADGEADDDDAVEVDPPIEPQ